MSLVELDVDRLSDLVALLVLAAERAIRQGYTVRRRARRGRRAPSAKARRRI